MSTSEGRELERIKQGDKVLLKELYKKHRSPFMSWAERRYSSYQDDIPDVYQQAFTIFYFNVKEGKFTGLNSSIQTYLFGIGKNLLNKNIGNKHHQTEPLDVIPEIELPSEGIFEKFEATHRQILVKSILEKVGEPCKTILTRYYYDNFTMEAIAENMGYKTAMVAKKKKCECLMKIRRALKAKNISINQEEA